MSSAHTQANRIIAIETVLGPDALLLQSVRVREELGRMFTIDVELLATDGEVDFNKILGTSATVHLDLGKGGNSERYFNGVVSRFVQLENRGGFAQYRATLVPWLWVLTRTADCRVFQKKTVPDILKEVFDKLGFSDFEISLSETHPEREYCVQYRETDFNFVSRLMEEEGIYYFFRHEDGKHVMVLADSISAHAPFEQYDELEYYDLEKGAAGRQVMTEWRQEMVVQPGACALNDFDYLKPKSSLRVVSTVGRNHAESSHEIYDYPGVYTEHSVGENLAKLRIEELQAQHTVFHGRTTARGMASGFIFSLKKHARDDLNQDYLITGVDVQADAGDYGAGGASEGSFHGALQAIEKSRPFRPVRSTPRPFVQGPQTAMVVGPAGEEIYTDQHARVKVHFHWDRNGPKDENSSCWVRVSQPWAGKGWGSMATPRIGQEVVVDFLEGDPDQPIITGRVYNGESAPPYAGGQGVVSGLKSQTHKGAGSNEMSMDDTAGKEKITIHGQHDMNTTVEHDQTTTVHNNRTDQIDVNDSETVGNNQTQTVGADRTTSIGKNDNLSVGMTRNHSVAINETINIGAAQEVSIGAMQTVTVGANQDVNVGHNQSTTVSGKRSSDIGKDEEIKIGKKLSIDAGDEIALKTGSAQIIMKKDGSITIEGKDVVINGSGKITVKASSDVTIKGSKISAN